MSTFSEAIGAVRDALHLTDEVKRLAEAQKGLAGGLREHEKRLTRLEAKWETAIELMHLAGDRRKPKELSDEGD